MKPERERNEMNRTRYYETQAGWDAEDTALNFIDEIVSQLRETGSASKDLFNDYPNGDGYHHECHVDRSYDLQEAAAVLDELSDYEEKDSGLWEGLEPRKAIEAQAAYTYGNAVLYFWQRVIGEINDDATDGTLSNMLGEDGPTTHEQIEARVREIIADSL